MAPYSISGPSEQQLWNTHASLHLGMQVNQVGFHMEASLKEIWCTSPLFIQNFFSLWVFGKHRFGRKQYLTDDYPRKKGGATDGDNQHSRSAEGWCAESTSGTSFTNYFLQKLAYGFNVDKHISAPVGPRQLPSRADLQQTAWVLWLSRQLSWQLIRE